MDDQHFLREAYRYASVHSTDPSVQNGTVIVLGQNILTYGANHFPYKVAESAERWERPLKYSYVEHAERNAIYAAARKGTSISGAVMYSPWSACTDCARGIIQAGIAELVAHKPIMDKTPERWRASIDLAISMLTEAGVRYRMVDGYLHAPAIRFDGELFYS